MSEALLRAYRTLINKHFAAVQTDTLLGQCDDDKFFGMERKAKLFWDEFHALEIVFIESLKGVKNESD